MGSKSHVPFPKESFSKLVSVEASHWWFRARNRILIWVLKSKAGQFRNFLEIGCGTGFVLEGINEAFPDVTLHGSEYFDEGLEHARKRVPRASFKRLDATKMQEMECYDTIAAFDVIEHIEEDELVLLNLANALRPGGSLLISVPQHRWLWSVVDEKSCHVRRYTRQELLAKIRTSGLNISYATSFVFLLLPVMIMYRLRTQNKSYDPMDEFKLSKPLNWILEQIMRTEHILLKIGIRLPAGGSLLVLASKK